MKLSEWIDSRLPFVKTRQAAYQELSDGSGISVQTISAVDRGMRLKTYARAKALSDLTGGVVTVQELCE